MHSAPERAEQFEGQRLVDYDHIPLGGEAVGGKARLAEPAGEDGRAARAHLFVLVATNPPDNISSFGYIDGVWVVRRDSLVALATALRYNLVALNDERSKNEGRQEKSEILYQYVTSHEFQGRIEAIVEAFSGMQEEIEREKRWFNAKWSKQEKQIRAVIDNTQGMYADMQGYVGKALPTLTQLELPE